MQHAAGDKIGLTQQNVFVFFCKNRHLILLSQLPLQHVPYFELIVRDTITLYNEQHYYWI